MTIETSEIEKQRGKTDQKKNRQHVQELWDNYKRYNIHVMGIPEGEEAEKGIEAIVKQ